MPSADIPFAKLVDLVEGRLSPDERAQLLAQVANNPRIAAQVAQIEHIINLARTDTTEEVSSHITSRIIQLFQSLPSERRPTLQQHILAALQLDSRQSPLALGMRSSEQSSMRQLLYNAGEYDLVLQIASIGASWIVAGQLLGPCADGQVEVYSPTIMTQVKFNDQCEFELPPLPQGTYILTFQLTGIEIEVTELSLGP